MRKYVREKCIGKGSYGSVFVVRCRSNSKRYVLKKIPMADLNPKERRASKQEVQLVRSLKHPTIVAYKDGFLDGSTLCIVMTYCEGGDLSQHIKRQKRGRNRGGRSQRLPESQIMSFFAQMLLAIDFMHSRKILHRDLKSQNVFLTRGSESDSILEIKIGDFGIARQLSRTLDLAKTSIGTPLYMSPEVCNNRPYGLKSDIWSLGCILYEMCTGGRHPFDARDLRGLFLKIMRGVYSPIPYSYNSKIRDLVRRMLLTNPRRRPSVRDILLLPFVKKYATRYIYEKLKSVRGLDERVLNMTIDSKSLEIANLQIQMRELGIRPPWETEDELERAEDERMGEAASSASAGNGNGGDRESGGGERVYVMPAPSRAPPRIAPTTAEAVGPAPAVAVAPRGRVRPHPNPNRAAPAPQPRKSHHDAHVAARHNHGHGHVRGQPQPQPRRRGQQPQHGHARGGRGLVRSRVPLSKQKQREQEKEKRRKELISKLKMVEQEKGHVRKALNRIEGERRAERRIRRRAPPRDRASRPRLQIRRITPSLENRPVGMLRPRVGRRPRDRDRDPRGGGGVGGGKAARARDNRLKMWERKVADRRQLAARIDERQRRAARKRRLMVGKKPNSGQSGGAGSDPKRAIPRRRKVIGKVKAPRRRIARRREQIGIDRVVVAGRGEVEEPKPSRNVEGGGRQVSSNANVQKKNAVVVTDHEQRRKLQLRREIEKIESEMESLDRKSQRDVNDFLGISEPSGSEGRRVRQEAVPFDPVREPDKPPGMSQKDYILKLKQYRQRKEDENRNRLLQQARKEYFSRRLAHRKMELERYGHQFPDIAPSSADPEIPSPPPPRDDDDVGVRAVLVEDPDPDRVRERDSVPVVVARVPERSERSVDDQVEELSRQLPPSNYDDEDDRRSSSSEGDGKIILHYDDVVDDVMEGGGADPEAESGRFVDIRKSQERYDEEELEVIEDLRQRDEDCRKEINELRQTLRQEFGEESLAEMARREIHQRTSDRLVEVEEIGEDSIEIEEPLGGAVEIEEEPMSVVGVTEVDESYDFDEEEEEECEFSDEEDYGDSSGSEENRGVSGSLSDRMKYLRTMCVKIFGEEVFTQLYRFKKDEEKSLNAHEREVRLHDLLGDERLGLHLVEELVFVEESYHEG